MISFEVDVDPEEGFTRRGVGVGRRVNTEGRGEWPTLPVVSAAEGARFSRTSKDARLKLLRGF